MRNLVSQFEVKVAKISSVKTSGHEHFYSKGINKNVTLININKNEGSEVAGKRHSEK